MKLKKVIVIIVALIVASLLLKTVLTRFGTKHTNTQRAKQRRVITVSKRSTSSTLSYSGNVKPIRIYNVIAPVAGVINKMNFKYGSKVKQGQVLVMMSSDQFEATYAKAITDFLNAKDKLSQSYTKYQGDIELAKYGLISKEALQADASAYESNRLNLVSVEQTLENTIKKLPGGYDLEKIQKLTLADVKAVEEVLKQKFKNIPIIAKHDGVALFPTKKSGSQGDTDNGGSIEVGASVKQNQVIVSIGNISGLSIVISVGETNIDRIKKGEIVSVTLPAFPGMKLNGIVTAVASQAKQQSDGGAGGVATFPVEVQVPKLAEREQNLIKVGMSAKVSIIIKSPASIRIPISAVKLVAGKKVVTVIDAKTGKQVERPVTTGITTQTKVTILTGLKPGDKVVYYD